MKISIGRIPVSGIFPYKSKGSVSTVGIPLHLIVGTYLPSCLVHAQRMPEVLLRDGTRCVDLVPQDQEGNFRKFLNRQESIKLRLGLGEALVIGAINHKDDGVYLWEVVTPETTGF